MKRHIVFLFLLAFIQAVTAQQSQEQLAAYYFSQGDYEKAAELFEKQYQRFSNKYYYQMLYSSYIELGQFKDAQRLIERRLKKYPKELELYVDLGSLLERSGDQKRASKMYDKAMELVSTDSKQIADLAMAFESSGKLDYAVKTYKFVREKMRNNFIYVNEVATLYERMGDYESMMQEYFDLLDKSPGSLHSIQVSLQRVLNQTSNPKIVDGLRKTLVNRIQSQPNNKNYLEMMIWFALQQKDFEFAMRQAKAVDARFPDLNGTSLMRVAKIAASNQEYEVARDCYQYFCEKGPDHTMYFEGRVGVLESEFAIIRLSGPVSEARTADLAQRYRDALTELGKGLKTVPIMRSYSKLEAYHLHNEQAAVDILYDILDIPRLSNSIVSEVKLELADLLLFAGEIWDASLLYMQVEKSNKNDVVGAQAKYKNALLSYYNHDFEWAKSQLNVLRSSTSKLIANDAMKLSLLISDNMDDDSTYTMLEYFSTADLCLYRNMLDSAWALYEQVEHHSLSHALHDEVLMQKAKIQMERGRFAEADSLLQRLVDFYPYEIIADDALMLIAQINETHLNNPERAMACYETLLLNYAVSMHVDHARKRYNILKAKQVK